MKTIRPQFKRFPHRKVLAPTLLAAVAVLAFSALRMWASDTESLPASTLQKLDRQLLLVVKQNRGEAPFDKPTTLQPDVYKFRGRVLVEIEGSLSTSLFDQIASLGGQVVKGWGTATTFRAWVPFAQVETLASRADIRSITPARPSVRHRLRH